MSLNNDETIKCISIEYPNNLLFKNHVFLENFELIDLVGVPEQTKISQTINAENQQSYNAFSINKSLIDSLERIDLIFYPFKSRGQIHDINVEYMYQCGLFRKCSKFSSPKIVSIKIFDHDHDTSKDDLQIIKKSIQIFVK